MAIEHLMGAEAGSGMVQGRVQAQCGEGFLVSCEGAVIQARRAECCLHDVAPGDAVLCHAQESGGAYIVGLLERGDPGRPVRLVLDRGATLTASRGELAVSARRVRVQGREAVGLSGPEVAVTAEKHSVQAATLSVTAGLAEMRTGAVRLASGLVDWTAERVTQTVQRLYRTVTDFEESRIGRLRQIVRKTFSLRARQADIRAEERVKIDGDRIHLG